MNYPRCIGGKMFPEDSTHVWHQLWSSRSRSKKEESMERKFGPKAKDHPSIGEKCPACKQPFKEGDYTTLIPLGPGDDPEAQVKCRAERPYNAIAVEVHYTCATGRE